MLVLEIRFLTGRYAAASVTDPGAAEWPPHPARVYSALTAALHEEPEPIEVEERALEWLENAGPPKVLASAATQRQLGNVFVPTNDQKVLADIDLHIERLRTAESALAAAEGKESKKAEAAVKKACAALVDRSRASARADGKGTPSNAAELMNRRLKPQPRRFPVTIPEVDSVEMVWGDSPAPELITALDSLVARVARLGHSSSLVSMRVFESDRSGPPNKLMRRWVPADDGETILRVAEPGQLERLRREHERHRQVESRVLPADPVPYRIASDTPTNARNPGTVFSPLGRDWILFEVVAPPDEERRNLLDVSLTEHVARAMRGTLIRQIDSGTAPEALTGHDAEGRPSRHPHIAFVPLADVRDARGGGAGYATGSILGLALIPPHDLDVETRRQLLEAIHAAEREAMRDPDEPSGPAPVRLTLGRHGVLHLRRLREPSAVRALQPGRWTRQSRKWVTATAIALGRNPGNLQSRDAAIVEKAAAEAEWTIARCCENVRLPRPAYVWIHRRSLLDGSPAAPRFMPFPLEGSGPRRVCVHAELLFDEPVQGPVLLGAGRFFGLGLCAPASEER